MKNKLSNFWQRKIFRSKYISNIWLHIALIYFSVFSVGLVLVVPVADKHVEAVAKQALRELDSAFDAVHSELSPLTDIKNATKDCSELSVILKKKVFESNLAKEVGVFRPSGEVFCTNNANDDSFFLYKSIMIRLQHSGRTLSYTKSKVSQVRSVFLLFAAENGYGVTALIPPRYIFRVLDDISEVGLKYRIDVISRDISGTPSPIQQSAIARSSSERYPLRLSIYTSRDYYTNFFVVNSWIGLLIAALATIYYFYARNRFITSNSLESALQKALRNGELDVHYQPIVDSRNNKILGFESLVRWKDPKQGYISPGIFIPLAEKLNLIDPITKQVISKVVEFIKQHEAVFSERYISINISRSLILQPEFVEQFTSLYRERPEITSKIVFEITEDIDFSNQELELLKTHLTQISDLGILVAIDDFGTGYSGLDFIRQYPFDIIKIDRVFVNNLSEDSTIIPLLDSMKMISNTLNMKVIVEGVEEKSQLDILSSLGFFSIQGFYYYHPMPESEILNVLETNELN